MFGKTAFGPTSRSGLWTKSPVRNFLPNGIREALTLKYHKHYVFAKRPSLDVWQKHSVYDTLALKRAFYRSNTGGFNGNVW